MGKDGVASRQMKLPIDDQSGKRDSLGSCSLTNRAFLRQVTTSDGNVEDTWGCVVVADASQLSGCCWTVAMVGQPEQE